MANVKRKFVLPVPQSEVATLKRINTENSKHIFPEKELCGHNRNFYIDVFVSDIYVYSLDRSAFILLKENM
jgi:hypothetical protein